MAELRRGSRVLTLKSCGSEPPLGTGGSEGGGEGVLAVAYLEGRHCSDQNRPESERQQLGEAAGERGQVLCVLVFSRPALNALAVARLREGGESSRARPTCCWCCQLGKLSEPLFPWSPNDSRHESNKLFSA